MAIENAVLSKLMEDKAFVEKMLAQENPEAVRSLFAENGVEFTLEEVLEIGRALDQLTNPGDELDENALEDVSGGVAVTATAWAVAKAAIAIGGAGLAIYKWYKSR